MFIDTNSIICAQNSAGRRNAAFRQALLYYLALLNCTSPSHYARPTVCSYTALTLHASRAKKPTLRSPSLREETCAKVQNLPFRRRHASCLTNVVAGRLDTPTREPKSGFTWRR